jgi:hypothetical protein
MSRAGLRVRRRRTEVRVSRARAEGEDDESSYGSCQHIQKDEGGSAIVVPMLPEERCSGHVQRGARNVTSCHVTLKVVNPEPRLVAAAVL